MTILSKIKLFIFGKQTEIPEEDVIKPSHFSVEYYPLTKRYYPKYKNYYMQKNHHTGIMQLKESYLFPYADYALTENHANKIIELFKEQQLKENVLTIKK